MKSILCYGDSNTWGFDPNQYNPNTEAFAHCSRDVRWTGRLQRLLGGDYYVIEAGLREAEEIA
ncbi:MAG: hypothetical protein A3E87_10695 [Gammaproteobacteria bacterium RIFCSPHIGHO2_12_FULL_35_23]|nr:MAG: hypothetical protein A3E87_10695 [Gammaproteobacteria bacterium RIFCSPHIGHO2_12_FULL_35_23]